jgi:PAS domain S-box-containing protein
MRGKTVPEAHVASQPAAAAVIPPGNTRRRRRLHHPGGRRPVSLRWRELVSLGRVSPGPVDATLARHLDRIRGYMRGTGLARISPERCDLRQELAAFVERETPALLDVWLPEIGPALGIPEADWPGIKADQVEAIRRWARHIADPSDVETYLFLFRHTRRGFISHFPASRFLAAQMRFVWALAASLRRAYAHEPERAMQLLRLLWQEFQERVLHITDFFVQAREEELLEQEESYRRAIDRSPACILSVDAADGTLFDANLVAERLLGWSRHELLRRPLEALHPPGERPRATALWKAAIERGHASRDDLHLLNRAGDAIPVFSNAGYIEYANRHYVQLICVDISDRKRLESQLIQSEKMAAIGQLAAGIAHELRNPLAIVMNALYDLRQIIDVSNAEVAEDLGIAEEEIGRAQAIIKNLLEFSRESGAELERIDVNDLLLRTLQLMQKYLQDNGVRVTTSLGPIPPCLANANAMRQILLNLVTNAVQAMPDGGELTLRTSVTSPNAIRLDVRDTGVGIPPERLQDIFNPFYTTKAPGQGTGLGLSVVHEIIRRHQGTIQVASQVGGGTTFTIDLPCQCHVEAADRAEG